MKAPVLATTLALSCLVTAATTAEAQWTLRRPVEITSTLAAPGADVPVPVRLTTATFGYADARPDGADLRFATTDNAHVSGVFDLPHYLETWDASGDSLLWVKLPSVPGPGTTTVYLYYGNPAAADTSDLAATFPAVYQSTDGETLSGDLTADWFEIQAGHTVTVVGGTPLTVAARRLRIAGTLSAQGAGYATGGLLSPGGGPGGGLATTSSGASGGGYGGAGGDGGYDSGDPVNAGGIAYGDATSDAIDMGSGGGSSSTTTGGAGGGAITLTAQVLDVDGTIDADGAGAVQPGGGQGGGGGAGGGILLRAYDLTATGSLSAIGGAGSVGTSTANDDGGGGGGGRVKILAENPPANTATIAVGGGAGGPNGSAAPGQAGADGTVHVGTLDLEEVVATLGPADTVPVELLGFTVD